MRISDWSSDVCSSDLLKIRAGSASHAAHPLPNILGIDMAGTVESVGPGVTGWRAGDAVYGMTGGVGCVTGSLEIGRAQCRARVCQYVVLRVVRESLKNKQPHNDR